MPVHYAGISCNMEAIMKIAEKYNLFVLEDAAQCIGAFYNSKPVGSMGHMSAFSFHETKNIHCGEGGMLCINDTSLIKKAEIVRDKGTNRQQFFRGEIDKYSWKDKGSSYLMSELQAAYLYAQLEKVEEITKNRLETWNFYHKNLEALEFDGLLQRPIVSDNRKHNAHIYYFLLLSAEMREKMQNFLKKKGIAAVPHFVPLHEASGGKKFGKLGVKEINVASDVSERLLRLPLYYGLTEQEKSYIIESIKQFFSEIFLAKPSIA